MTEPLIVCENLVKIYSLSDVEVVALQGLDISVEAGEILGIVGASGSGKTTLLNVLGGLDRPSAGRVQVNGRDLLKLSDRELDNYRRTKVGFVWQQTTRNLIPYLSALENVELPMRLANIPANQRRIRARELLEALDLGARVDHQPMTLSGGEQQRVAIAVALANQPRILLADEPTGEVDSATAQEIYIALRKMVAVDGITALVVSHDPNLGHFADRVVAIRDGKTSTETIRHSGMGSSGDGKAGAEAEPTGDGKSSQGWQIQFDELVVLDSAGRLQIPRELLETLDIGDRVRLEASDGGILIHPVAGRGRSSAPHRAMKLAGEVYLEQDRPPEKTSHGLGAGFKSLRDRMQRQRWAQMVRQTSREQGDGAREGDIDG